MTPRYQLLISLLLLSCAHVEERATSPAPQPGLGPEETIPDLPRAEQGCAEAQVVSLEDLTLPKFQGLRVAIDAVPQVQGNCTLLACFSAQDGRQRACCNQCGGQYIVETERLRVYLLGAGTCGGYECNFHCEPFGRKPTHQYRFVGVNQFDSAGQSMFKVETVCRLP